MWQLLWALLESKLPTRREQTHGLANTPFARLRALRRMNPNDEIAALAGCELLKELPNLVVTSELLGNITWQLRNTRFCGIRMTRRRRCKPRRAEQAFCLELSPSLPIQVGPFACGLSGRDLYRVTLIIDALDQAVDPPEAQCLANHIFISDASLRSMNFIEREPDPRARRIVLYEPRPPRFPGLEAHDCEF